MRDTVLYVEGFGLPDRTASALRALGNATVLRLARDALDRMRARASEETSFAPSAWVPRMQDFMRALRMPR
jgi:hypothetical protein